MIGVKHQKIVDRGLCRKGQNVLDLGTGTGVLPQNMYRYGATWTGAGETRHPIWIPDIAYEYFDVEDHEEYDCLVPFTRESWHGRMKACRGVGASLCCLSCVKEEG